MLLSKLPIELIVQIFESVDKISSAAALSHTSRDLHSIWRSHLASICDAVLPRTIECYDEAYLLLEARENSTLVASQLSDEGKAKAAIVRAKVLFTNVDLAGTTLKDFEELFVILLDIDDEQNVHFGTTPGRECQLSCTKHGDRTLGPFSRIRFLQGFYRAMSMVFLAGKNATKRYQILASLHLLDLFRMFEVMEVIFYKKHIPDGDALWPGYDFRPRIQSEDSYPGEGEIIDSLDFLGLLATDLAQVSGIEQPFKYDGGAFCPLFLHEMCLTDNIKRAKGIAVADLLPRLPRNVRIKPDYELLAPQ